VSLRERDRVVSVLLLLLLLLQMLLLQSERGRSVRSFDRVEADGRRKGLVGETTMVVPMMRH